MVPIAAPTVSLSLAPPGAPAWATGRPDGGADGVSNAAAIERARGESSIVPIAVPTAGKFSTPTSAQTSHLSILPIPPPTTVPNSDAYGRACVAAMDDADAANDAGAGADEHADVTAVDVPG